MGHLPIPPRPLPRPVSVISGAEEMYLAVGGRRGRGRKKGGRSGGKRRRRGWGGEKGRERRKDNERRGIKARKCEEKIAEGLHSYLLTRHSPHIAPRPHSPHLPLSHPTHPPTAVTPHSPTYSSHIPLTHIPLSTPTHLLGLCDALPHAWHRSPHSYCDKSVTKKNGRLFNCARKSTFQALLPRRDSRLDGEEVEWEWSGNGVGVGRRVRGERRG